MSLTLKERLALRKQSVSKETTNEASDLSTKETTTVADKEKAETKYISTSITDSNVQGDKRTSAIDLSPISASPSNDKPSVKTSPISTDLLAKASATAKKEMTEDDILDELDKDILRTANIAVDEIVPRIENLNNLSEADLPNEMRLLKEALKANPAAVSLMLPEHVGEMVKALRTITHEAKVEANTTKKKTKKPKKKEEPVNVAEIDDF